MVTRIDQGSRMSQAVIHGDTVYLAGQVGTPGESITAQTNEVLAKIEDLLARSGSGKHLLLRVTIWLADMADFDGMNSVWDAWVADIELPARATCGVGPATPTYKVEIVATAARE
jgi:enamine deaminase RidA (YjgF/YER057c/UK114 family)